MTTEDSAQAGTTKPASLAGVLKEHEGIKATVKSAAGRLAAVKDVLQQEEVPDQVLEDALTRNEAVEQQVANVSPLTTDQSSVPRGGLVRTDANMRYVIDAENRISFVDEEWDRFAEANEGAELLRPAILGQSLWDHITDPTTRTLYQQIVSRVRQGKLARFTLRCDGPACRRLLEMTIRAAADGSVAFETSPVRVEDREPVALLARSSARSTDLLRSCAWCNRVDVGSGAAEWVAVEDATARLRLFELGRMPELTHGICEACLASMMDTLANLDAST